MRLKPRYCSFIKSWRIRLRFSVGSKGRCRSNSSKKSRLLSNKVLLLQTRSSWYKPNNSHNTFSYNPKRLQPSSVSHNNNQPFPHHSYSTSLRIKHSLHPIPQLLPTNSNNSSWSQPLSTRPAPNSSNKSWSSLTNNCEPFTAKLCKKTVKRSKLEVRIRKRRMPSRR